MQGPLDSVLVTLARQYGMAQPVDDLLYSDLYGKLAGQIQTGQYLGKEKVDGKKCDHLAFTQLGVSWQVWIEEGRKPAPRKLVVTYDNAPGRPQYWIMINKWETPAFMGDRDFKAKLPDGAMSTSMTSLTGQAGQ
jgi:hypothetical protein